MPKIVNHGDSVKTSAQKKKAIKAVFHRKGLKCTPQRVAVLSVLSESIKHLSISDIHRRVKKLLPGTGLATVYRALEALADLGLVVRVHLEDGCHSYTMAPDGHQHPMVCLDCNRVVEFAECPLEDISNRLSKETGFVVQKHFVQLFGKCRECQG